ncbi:hypothetical protein Tco_1389002, partial [Tanacetum coccineum]
MLPGENINEYYVRFHKLVNDMGNIRMTMPNIQLNSKFVNNMSAEYDRFVTAVKLNKGLKETNHEQLYAYLKQHEKHAAQDRLIIEKITPTTNDPLAFVSDVQPYAQLSHQEMGEHKIEMGMTMHVKANRSSVITAMGLDISHETILSQSVHRILISSRSRCCWQAQENGAVLDEEELLFLAGDQTNTFDADVDDQPVRYLAQNNDTIFQDNECDAFDSDVDDEPTAQSIFMANLSSFGPANLQAGPSNASILSEVHDLENSIDHCDIDQDEHEIHNEVQQKISLTQICAPSVPIDASVLHDNNAYIPHDPLVTELSIYKQQVAMYEQRAKFDLTLREHKMDEQMRMLIQDRNKKEENIKNELHSVKLQLNSTIKSNTIIKETVTALKHEFKQKETKFLTDFSNLKTLNDKLENMLYAQDQSIQTVHMMLKPKKLHDHDDVTAVEHFEEVQRSLVKEVRAIKAVFENMEAEVDQNAIDKKCREIERKNLLITNENLIANCIAQDVLYTVTDSALSASQFHDLSTAYNVAMTRVVDLESKNSKLLDKIQHDSHDTMSSEDFPEFDTFFELGIRDDQIQGNRNTIRKLKAQISQLKANKSDVIGTHEPTSLDSQH